MGCTPITKNGAYHAGDRNPNALSLVLNSKSGTFSIDNMDHRCTVGNLRKHINLLLFPDAKEQFYDLFYGDVLMENDCLSCVEYGVQHDGDVFIKKCKNI
jgi:hypothetical protein